LLDEEDFCFRRRHSRLPLTGVQLIEELARKPRVHVAAWKLADDDVRSTVRDALLQMRHLAVNNIVLMTSRNVTDLLLDTVGRLANWTLKLDAVECATLTAKTLT